MDFSAHMGDAMIKPDVENLLSLCMNNLNKKLLTSKSITIGGVDYVLQFNSRAMNLVRAEEIKEKNPIKAEILSSGEANRELVPSIIEANCMYGLTQYFFVKNDNDTYQIFNSSENQELRIYDNFKASISELILDITSYYTRSQSQFSKEKEKHRYRQYFNLPQFFLVDVSNNTISPL
jgi:adenylate cyclase class 1